MVDKKKPGGMALTILAGLPGPKKKMGKMDEEMDEMEFDDLEDEDMEEEMDGEEEEDDFEIPEDDEVMAEGATPEERAIQAVTDGDPIGFRSALEELITSILDQR
jgi:hypothetical protein